ncbi:MAG: ABC transporter substrate-binding protein [Bacillota bacterium]|nr:ABC transporter substrate-binding protein [Bacillota bacterium]
MIIKKSSNRLLFRQNDSIRHPHLIYCLVVIAIGAMLLTGLSGCQTQRSVTDSTFSAWEQVIENGRDQEVTILMWGGNDSINQYMDNFVASHLKEQYGIILKRVPMNAPEFIIKLLNEKKASVETGSADLLWINAENFRTARQGNLLWGPITTFMPNLSTYYDAEAADLNFDTGIPIEGYEAIWGRAQLVLTYDAARTADVPTSFAEMLEWARQNPGRLTYPKLPDDFVGTAFVRTAYYELTGQTDAFQKTMTRDEFLSLSQPVIDYFKELAPFLWREGTAYPATQAQLDDLFKNGEVDMTMGFEVGKTAGLVETGVYPDTVRTMVFDTGTIGNAHYLAVPYNAPQKAAALLAIDFLQSPLAQIEKMKPDVWGDMPALDVRRLSEPMQLELAELEAGQVSLSLQELTDHRLPEMQSQYIDWIKEIWTEKIGGQ